jgi:hypothetical protein
MSKKWYQWKDIGHPDEARKIGIATPMGVWLSSEQYSKVRRKPIMDPAVLRNVQAQTSGCRGCGESPLGGI